MGSATQTNATPSVQNENWRNILRESAKQVFAVMVGLPAEDPANDELPVEYELTGMIGLAGALQGILTIRCSAESATRISSHMLGIDVADAAEHQTDAIGEMCNMIAGNFKANIEGMEDRCMLSVPTVITGSQYEVRSLSVSSQIDLVLVFEGKPVWIGLEIHS